MCPRESYTLATLTKITSIRKKLKWTNVEQDAFDKIKRIVACDTLLNYLDFNEAFKIHNNCSAFQLEAVIRQKVKPIALYTKKLNDAQNW